MFGADKLRKAGRRMEGSVRNLGPGAEGLSTGFPRPGSGGMILESSWKAPGSSREHGMGREDAGRDAGLAWSICSAQEWLEC